jgi:copper homeostasis protein
MFELCAETLEAVEAGECGGADRAELCVRLEVGGLTPPLALTAAAVRAVSMPIFVLIRPREGDFVYSAAEFSLMKQQIEKTKQAGAGGVVLGVQRVDGRVDVERSRELVELARPMAVTFHRAFDRTPDLSEALEAVIATGADYLLTSGGAPQVLEGAEALAQLVRQAGERIRILAGGGLRLENLAEIVERSGVQCLHGSLSHHAEDGATLEARVRKAVGVMESIFCCQ